ncbi:MAG: hypothetical protein Q9213_000267 [Squamulea squamosa]
MRSILGILLLLAPFLRAIPALPLTKNLTAPKLCPSGRPVENHVVYLRRTPLPVELRASYCPLATTELPSLRRALYVARLAFSNRIRHEGYATPLGPPYRTPHEAGRDCVFTATMDVRAPMEHQMSVGLVNEVLTWLWEYLVKDRETRSGSIEWDMYVGISGHRRSGWGYIGPVMHPLTQRLGTE